MKPVIVRRLFQVLVITLWAAAACLAANQDVPFKLAHGYVIVVKCSVADLRDVTAIVDTGSTQTVVDMRLARRLGLATHAETVTFLTQNASVLAVSIPSIQLGSIRVESMAGTAMDLSSLESELGFRPDVMIGMDILRRTSFMIDYKKRRLRFAAPRPAAHSAKLARGGRFAIIESKVLGKILRLKIDTGFNSLLVYAGRIRVLPGLAESAGWVKSAVQTARVHIFEAPEIQVGGWHAFHVAMGLTDESPPNLADFDGLLGPRLLASRRVAFDFDNMMLYWD